MFRLFLSSFSTLFLFNSCDPAEIPVQLPTNLVFSLSVSNTDPSLVEVVATANMANYYTFQFEEGTNGTVESTDGTASYTYALSGKYPVRLRAHVSFEHYIEAYDTVLIQIATDTSNIPTTGYSTPLSYPGYSLVWQDEFLGTELSEDWTFELGNGNWGWGNNELQYYKEENTQLKQGCLVITAKEQAVGGFSYTSSRLITKGKQSFQYGRIDIRAALPSGQGLWPALWMLGDNISTVGWPACGEIDIMEMTGGSTTNQGDQRIHGTGHWDNGGNHASYGGSIPVQNGKSYQDEFHVFSIIWDENAIKWYRDDVLYTTLNISGSTMSEFHEKFFFILNVAVGGNWPGSPNAQTTFPQRMAVDYIRVFQL
ncbi:MAG: glycoside hydrolase family 16 protein [Flavobacteriales bacterium]